MKTVVLALVAALLPISAHAINRYNVSTMSCGAVHAIIDREGAAILRYPSPRSGIILYDRYVASDLLCDAYEYPDRTYIPTADTQSCPVYHCRRVDLDLPFGIDR